MIIYKCYFLLRVGLSDYLVTSVVITERLQLTPLPAIYRANLIIYLITLMVPYLVKKKKPCFFLVFFSPLSINILLGTLLWSNIRSLFYSSTAEVPNVCSAEP